MNVQPTPRRFKQLLVVVSIWAMALHLAGAPAAGGLDLTAEQQAWLAAHRTIRVGVDPAWPPFSSASGEGRCAGIDVDMLNRLGLMLGVRFEFGTRWTWSEVYAAAKRGEFDVLAGTAATGDRRKFFEFTEPYLSFPVVIVTRNDEPLLWSVLDMAGRTVVGVRGYAPTSELLREYPALQLVLVDTTEQALRQVADGDADAFVSNLPNVSFLAKTQGLTNLKIAGVLADRFDLRYAVRPDWPELVQLLNRAVDRLPLSERQAIVHPWIRVDYAKVIRWDLVWKTGLCIFSVLAVVLGAVIYHSRCLARELEKRIRLQRQIEEAHDELLHLNEDKTELLQMAAHDLRGPLTGMQLVVDASLRLHAVPKDDALLLIETKVKQMAGLLNDLLDVEALEHGRREFRLAAVDPAIALREAVNTLGASAAMKAVRVELDLPETGLPLVHCDATALRQMIDNLLSNAIKFSPSQRTVRIRGEAREPLVRFEFRDEGPGVAEHETERIFVKYARGSAKPTAGEKSTGLGLSIVRQLAAAMNGRVWCESGRGGGYFVLAVPMAGVPARQSQESAGRS